MDLDGNLTSVANPEIDQIQPLLARFAVEPTESLHVFYYYDFMDQISYLGGIFVVLAWILSLMTPFFVLRYSFIMA